MNEVKQIKLEAGTAYVGHMKVSVLDYPKGVEAKDEKGITFTRKRCEIDVEYSESDFAALKAKGLTTKEEALKFYKDWMYALIKQLLSFDWEVAEGMNEIENILLEKMDGYFAP